MAKQQANTSTAEPLGNAILVHYSEVAPNTYQPRSEFDQAKIEEYAHVMKDLAKDGGGISGTGWLQPALIRRRTKNDVLPREYENAKYIIIAGETRWRATQLAGVEMMPAIVTTATEEQAFEQGLLENIMRNDLKPLDEARAFRYLMNVHNLSTRGVTKRVYGEKSLKSKLGYVQTRLQLLDADEDVQVIINERPNSVYIARRINQVKEPKKRKELIQMALAGASKSTIEAEVKAFNSGISVERQKGHEEIERFEKKYEKEAAAASSTGTGNAPATSGRLILPRVDLETYLDNINAQADTTFDAMKPATLNASTRKKLLPKVERMLKLATAMKTHIEGTQAKGNS